jgi:dCMP deaminase
MSSFHKEKFHPMYQQLTEVIAEQSYCVRKKVGAVLVTRAGTIGIGFNGTKAGKPNVCELLDGTTDPEVTHAEINAIDKMSREGVSPLGSIVFVTLSPCINCAKSLAAVGVSAVYYRDLHRQEAIEHLNQMGIITKQWSK